ncbi:caspase domain-containing protein [Lactifluus subvellereus]|nr:caspase domain-containing protein [Lactifluus subvellereus]
MRRYLKPKFANIAARVKSAATACLVPLLGNISQHAAIERLPDEVLLKIFNFDRHTLSQDLPWEWHRLVHVCRRWRYIIFDSPRSLDLQLFCTYGTPVKDKLDCWPVLPIVMRYAGLSSLTLPEAAGDEDNIIAALQHPNRICTIQLAVTTPLLERLATLAQDPLPVLQHLELSTQTETGLILPSECFGGPSPHLRVLRLARIAFPALQRLLLSAEDLVSLKLEALPSSGYTSPEDLINCLPVMTRLETLHLHFNFRISRFIAGGNISAPQRRLALPSLEDFSFHGASEYLECLLSGIDAPVLKNIDIAFFNQATIFHTPQLLQFVCRTETQRCHDEAKVYCSRDDISITLTRQGAPHCMGLRVRCMSLDWQLSCMAEICDNLSLIISDVRDLHIDASSPLSGGQGDMDPVPLLNLFHPFGNVVRLFLTEKVAWHVKYALKQAIATDVLPNAKVIAAKQRALLVGITYCSPSNMWSRLDGPYDDVDRYQDLLITTYDYRPEDITVLKDHPDLPEDSQPTRVNMIRELKGLVSGAGPGDRFTFFYSGHTDQQPAIDDLDEEDGMDEVIITSDEQRIIDNELNAILVSIPVGCSLIAIFDASHSGTLLDLPHHHCNSVYVPWQSKGKRRTMTMQNINVRRQALDFTNSISQVLRSIETAVSTQPADSPSYQTPRAGTQIGGSLPTDPSELSSESQSRGTARPRERWLFPPQARRASPERRLVCDGWCKYNEVPHPNVSISACSDLQSAWEGPHGSLTTVLCNYLKTHNHPTYRALMSQINFQLHDNALALHEYTRHQRQKAARGEGSGFDGELDNFQEPVLSSLMRLNMDDTLQL